MKHIIICADGTWNRDEIVIEESGKRTSTNVAKLAACLAACTPDGIPQALFYMEGVGSKESEKVAGGAFGWGLSRNILQAYQFLFDCYDAGDRIYLFGFSRGAYSVRSLAGLICNSGIVKDAKRVKDAMMLYQEKSDSAKATSIRSRIFRKQHSHDVSIHFLGVWDTVGAMGLPFIGHQIAKNLGWAWDYHTTGFDQKVENACHAVSIHERRGKFQPVLAPTTKAQNVEEKWFYGVHSDVGGGYVESGLSNITLSWMMDRAHDCGLAFTPKAEQNLNITTDSNPDNLKPEFREKLDPVEFTRHEEWKGFFKLVDMVTGFPRGRVREHNTGDFHETVALIEAFLQSHLVVMPSKRRNISEFEVIAGKSYRIRFGLDKTRHRDNKFGPESDQPREKAATERWLCTVEDASTQALELIPGVVSIFNPTASGRLCFQFAAKWHERWLWKGHRVIIVEKVSD